MALAGAVTGSAACLTAAPAPAAADLLPPRQARRGMSGCYPISATSGSKHMSTYSGLARTSSSTAVRASSSTRRSQVPAVRAEARDSDVDYRPSPLEDPNLKGVSSPYATLDDDDEEDDDLYEDAGEATSYGNRDAAANAAAQLEALRKDNQMLRARMESATLSPYKVPQPSGDGTDVIKIDPYLEPYKGHLQYRYSKFKERFAEIEKYEGGLEKFSRGYEKFGFTLSRDGITYREWAPAATKASLIGDFNNWDQNADPMTKNPYGVFELNLPNNADGTPAIPHGSKVKIRMLSESGEWIDRIPAWIKYAVQPEGQVLYDGVYWDAPEKYEFKHPRPPKPRTLRIYEAHVGMSSVDPKISTYIEFRDTVLPRIKDLGYNAVQLMAVMEHAYYGSFGYHITNFFAVSSRCGTPEDLKSLIDRAHELGLTVLMDVVHSHASKNVLDGLNNFDGSDSHYFHSGERGYHWMWDSRLFNYGSWEVMRFLLSNLRFWIEEYQFDGFRFDGITSMMYTHHGLQMTFTGDYGEYLGLNSDIDAINYLMLANDMLHHLYPFVITIAEDVSGMPTLCRPVREGGVGFDYRLQMAIADKWIEVLDEYKDEEWDIGNICFTLTNRRWDEKCIAYAESHDQALVGDKTIAFWLMDKEMYWGMALDSPPNPIVDRGIALHKMIRLITLALGGNGYLNFMGNEFGHPEWIDFPRGDRFDSVKNKWIPGNGNSYEKCRRRFDLADANFLKYQWLNNFDRAMNHLDEQFEFVASEHQYVSRKDEADKLIVFERGDLVFVFNFHYNQSFTDYRVGCLKPGKYKIVLSTDEKDFGGWANATKHANAEFFTQEGYYDNRPHSFMVYAPSRTAVVYAPAEFNDPLDQFCEEKPEADECRMYDE